MTIAEPLGHNIYQLPLVDPASIYRTSGYLIKEEKILLIETGAAPSNAVILSALKDLGIQPEQVDYIAVTHIHLDHAGGAGQLMNQCPNAKLLVHKRGKAHMVEPSKLIAGARQVYGNKFDSLFSPIHPVPEDRIQVMEDGTTLNLGNHREIVFLDAPGHAFHHFAIHDPVSRGIFSGDSAGIFLRQLFDDHGIAFCLPVTAPPQFVPEIMDQTLSRFMALAPERIYFTHYGMGESALDLLRQAKERTAFFGGACVEFFRKERSGKKLFTFIREQLHTELRKLGLAGDFPEMTTLDQDIKLNVQGIIAYLEKQEKT